MENTCSGFEVVSLASQYAHDVAQNSQEKWPPPPGYTRQLTATNHTHFFAS